MEIITWKRGEKSQTSSKSDKPILNENKEIVPNLINNSQAETDLATKIKNFGSTDYNCNGEKWFGRLCAGSK